MIQKYNAASASAAALDQSTGKPVKPKKPGGDPEDKDTALSTSSPKKRVRFAIDAAETSAEPDEDVEWVMVDVDAELKATTDNKESRGVLQVCKAFIASRKSTFCSGR
ncbi:hypothetical protein LTR74_011679 [Friedmanniomyces endolithicus]|nr:hypothetical protein LTR74_011679 [Friedmanniomyces endolithicus]